MRKLRVALLTNIVPPYRVPVFKALGAQNIDLHILATALTEPNRNWEAPGNELPLTVQRSFVVRERQHHPHHFTEHAYVHIPLDTVSILRGLRPDVVISGEFGLRSIHAGMYKLANRRVKLLLWATVSNETEKGRGFLRVALRRCLLAWADGVITNGESGRDYLEALGAKRVFIVHQCTDNDRFSAYPIARLGATARRFLFVGQLVARKGLQDFLEVLSARCVADEGLWYQVLVVGVGREAEKLKAIPLSERVTVEWRGDVAFRDLPSVYQEGGIFVLPTLADEWGMVVNEALASGLPVLGSAKSQAVSEIVVNGYNGWTYDSSSASGLKEALDQVDQCAADQLDDMRANARESIRTHTPEAMARGMADAVARVAGTCDADRLPRVAVLVNLIPPYRAALFRKLREKLDLHVFWSGSEPNRTQWHDGKTGRSLSGASLMRGLSLSREIRDEEGVYDYRSLHITFGAILQLWKLKPDAIISAEMGTRTICAFLFALVMRKPLWVWWGGTEDTERHVGAARRLIRRRLAATSVKWLTYGESATAYLCTLGIDKNRVTQLQNCVDEAAYLGDAPARFQNADVVFLYVGQLIRRKGIHHLLAAAAELQGKGRRFSIVIVGDGPERSRLEELSRASALQNVEFVGPLAGANLRRAYRSADCLVLPTVEDNWGLVINEALWCGTSVIASTAAGASRELLPNTNLFNAADHSSICAALERVLDGQTAPAGECVSRLIKMDQVVDRIVGSVLNELTL